MHIDTVDREHVEVILGSSYMYEIHIRMYSELVCICMYGIDTMMYKLFCAQKPHTSHTS